MIDPRGRHVRLAGALLGAVAVLALALALAVRFDLPGADLVPVATVERWFETVANVLTVGFAERTLEAATPIALAAVGGLYAERSGVFNIGLEGFMIVGAVSAAIGTSLLGGSSPTQGHVWLSVAGAAAVSLACTAVFAVLLLRYRADQIVAGLAVWFVALGFGPFAAILVWGNRSSPGLASVQDASVPLLSEVPILGPVLFDGSPFVWLTALVAVAAWVVLFRTRFGYWVQAAGENPEALATAGVSVTRVRYAAVLFSGVLAGLGGAVLFAHVGSFAGTGDTMVDGRGWIGIVAYLFGNYNPVGAALAATLFGALDMVQIQFQTAGIDVPNRLVNLFPYVAVVIVLTLWGKTRMPSAVGEHYESED